MTGLTLSKSTDEKQSIFVLYALISFVLALSLMQNKGLEQVASKSRKELHAARRVTKLQNICFVKQHRHRTN